MPARFFLLRPNGRLDDEGRRPLTLIVTRGRGRKIGVPAGKRVRPRDWLQSEQRVRTSVTGAAATNAALNLLRADAEALAMSHPDDRDLKAALLKRVGRVKETPEATFLEHFEAFLSDKRIEVRTSTMKVFETLKSHLSGFLPEDMRVGEISRSMVSDFQKHLLDKGLNNNSANKYSARLRTFLLWLEENEIIDAAPKMKALKTAHSEVVRLTLDELAALRAANVKGEPAALRKARDIFLFSAYTGLRFGDCRDLTWDRVGNDAVFLAEEKTSKFRRIPITPAAREILDRYRDSKRPLPVISNQKANDAIKEVAKLAKITTPVVVRDRKGGEIESLSLPKCDALSMHDGRRTFISLMLETGVSTKELLGVTHTDLRSLQRYAAASEDHLRNAMNNVFTSTQIG